MFLVQPALWRYRGAPGLPAALVGAATESGARGDGKKGKVDMPRFPIPV